jgi:hypothetical protein
VHEPAGSVLSDWESFYVIVGSSAAALTGLQFVVMALLAETRRRSSTREIDAFGTPTIVHFGAVLLQSAILSAPWRHLTSTALLLGMCGATGLSYVALVIHRARRQTGYRLVMEDWLWHTMLPLVAYGVLLVSAVTLVRDSHASLFAMAAVSMLLLFIGIHNSWDTVTYITLDHVQSRADSARHSTPPEPAIPSTSDDERPHEAR